VKYKIWIKRTAVDFIFQNGNTWLPKETGGVILGYRTSDSEFVITDVIGPGASAIHKYAAFEPDQTFHEHEIARIYKESNYCIIYLGDWHTHPNSYPYLSNQDKSTIKKIALYKGARIANPLMLIAAPPDNKFKIWVYEACYLRKGEVFYKTDIILF
jgi:integrative and conjugative element protein (TIGR02256 family)